MTQRIGIFGGTFDPIHIGHLVCAEEARQQYQLDKIIFMPAGKPALKDFSSIASAEDRYWMCCLATADNDSFEVSNVEIKRVGTTYTIDTLREVDSKLDPLDELFFIMGADALIDVPLWKDANLVSDYAHFIAATRPGYDVSEARACWQSDSHILPMTLFSCPGSIFLRQIFAKDICKDCLIAT